MQGGLRFPVSASILLSLVLHYDTPLRMLSEASLAAKRRNGNSRRRIETLLIKAREIEGYGVDIAIILKRNNKYTTYGSALPLLLAEIVADTLPIYPTS